MLRSRIFVPAPTTPSPEDIFSSALPNLFTDDTQNSHGTPGGSLVYTSPRFGDIILEIPAHPDVEEGRNLFAHYLWDAAVVAAEGIEVGSSGRRGGVGDGREKWDTDPSTAWGFWDPRWWDMRGQKVLELGAGTRLSI